MKQVCFLFLVALVVPQLLIAQNVGIGTNSPLSRLHVEQDTVLFNGPASLPAVAGQLPVSGAGVRLMWYPDKAAFRAGRVTGIRWDKDSVGLFSMASGYDTKATRLAAVAMGWGNSAGPVSTGDVTVQQVGLILPLLELIVVQAMEKPASEQ